MSEERDLRSEWEIYEDALAEAVDRKIDEWKEQETPRKPPQLPRQFKRKR